MGSQSLSTARGDTLRRICQCVDSWKGSEPLTETSDEPAYAEMVEDIAALARKLAEKEPYKSASGPEALLALAAHLDEMIGADRADQPRPVGVAVRKKRAR